LRKFVFFAPPPPHNPTFQTASKITVTEEVRGLCPFMGDKFPRHPLSTTEKRLKQAEFVRLLQSLFLFKTIQILHPPK
jgi:hypothetical protein